MKKIIQEFKEFAFKGNVIDMAVGVVIGSAFTAIVTSVVNDLFTPLIALLTGSVDFSALVIKLGTAEEAPTLNVGNLIQTVINFLLIAVCVFIFVRGVNKLRKPAAAPKPSRLCPYCKGVIADEATRCPHCTSLLD